MFKRFFPKQEDFFELFQEMADEMVEASEQFRLLLKHLDNFESYAKAIQTHEEKADNIAETTLTKLHKTFITPFDRYDIHRFVQRLDDVLDAIYRTSKRIIVYQVKRVPFEIDSIAYLCVQAAEIIRKTVALISNLKNSVQILELCEQIDSLEGEAEQLLLSGMSRLFQEQPNHLDLLKTKEIYEYTKSIMKNCQGVAHIIKDVVLEYS
jgi:uncharacterized protein Yka (UPF0111/DUF47 family)